MSRHFGVTASALLVLVGCTAVDEPVTPSVPSPEAELASLTATHSHFFFLPPLGPVPQPTGEFDPGLSPTVRICALRDSACGAVIASFTRNRGTGGEVIRLERAGPDYRVDWRTAEFDLTDGAPYRIQVGVAPIPLGALDLSPANGGTEFRNLATGERIALGRDRVLPIRFRIEAGIVGAIEIAPTEADIEVRETQQFRARVFDLHGQRLAERVDWFSSDPSVATVSPTGLATGATVGLTRIGATSQGVTTVGDLSVFPISRIAWRRVEDIYVMTGFGKNQTALATAGFTVQPTWSPDGSRLAFVRDNQIWVMNADGSGQVPLTSGIDLNVFPHWSPSGTVIGFDRIFFNGGTDLFSVTPDGLTLSPITTTLQPKSSIVWSPDGTRLAFSQVVEPNHSDIYVANADGSGLTDLTTDAVANDESPDWSPDGSTIVFERGAFPAVEDLIVMNAADGTGKTNLTPAFANGAISPHWSPDGGRILFRSAHDLWVMNADGSNPVQLTNSPTIGEDLASWSPEGKRIVFEQHVDGENTADIGLIKADGSKLWNLTNSPNVDDGEPVWRP